jgi:hypothetical protein
LSCWHRNLRRTLLFPQVRTARCWLCKNENCLSNPTNGYPIHQYRRLGTRPDGVYFTGFFARMFVDVAKVLLWSKPLADFQKQLAEVEEAKGRGLIRPTLVLPPTLNNSEKTNTYLAGEASTSHYNQRFLWIEEKT